jgi:hypothetical protein
MQFRLRLRPRWNMHTERLMLCSARWRWPRLHIDRWYLLQMVFESMPPLYAGSSGKLQRDWSSTEELHGLEFLDMIGFRYMYSCTLISVCWSLEGVECVRIYVLSSCPDIQIFRWKFSTHNKPAVKMSHGSSHTIYSSRNLEETGSSKKQ